MAASTPTSKPTFLLDTGPLSVLCSFPLKGTLYIYSILSFTNLALTQDVVDEVRAGQTGKMARAVSPLLKGGKITVVSAPTTPQILDAAYSKDLGLGERSTIRSALASGLTPVIDDKNAFIVACRFGLHPIGFQDFIVGLVRTGNLPKLAAEEIVKATSRQFPAMFLVHTLDMLR